jgi:hypothetical protein
MDQPCADRDQTGECGAPAIHPIQHPCSSSAVLVGGNLSVKDVKNGTDSDEVGIHSEKKTVDVLLA